MARARVRRGSLADLAVLVLHRRLMWTDIGNRTKRQLNAADSTYRRWLRARLKSGKCAAFVVEVGDEVVASGVIWIQEAQPRPGWTGTRQGYLLSMYTAQAHRGKGLASRIVSAALKWARSQGLDRVTLHASDQGKGLYARAGFERTREMRIVLRPGARTRKRPRRG